MFFFVNSSVFVFTLLLFILFRARVILFKFRDIGLIANIEHALSVNKFWLRFRFTTLLSDRA